MFSVSSVQNHLSHELSKKWAICDRLWEGRMNSNYYVAYFSFITIFILSGCGQDPVET